MSFKDMEEKVVAELKDLSSQPVVSTWKRVVSWIGIAFLAGVFVCFLLFGCARAEVVKKVHDGDTVTLENGRVLRIIGIDALELIQPGGKESGAFLRSLILNKDVEVTYIYSQNGKERKDRWGKRYLVYVHYAGVDIGLLMVKEGWAYVHESCHDPAYWNAMILAQKDRKGLWAMEPVPMNPVDFRKKIQSTYGGRE